MLFVIGKVWRKSVELLDMLGGPVAKWCATKGDRLTLCHYGTMHHVQPWGGFIVPHASLC